MLNCSFKLAHLRQTLQMAKEQGYAVSSFRDYEKLKDAQKLIILRHDIDFRVDRAYEIAKVEASLGITSSFFIRVHAGQYNPFEYNTYTLLSQIRDWGFELGLHFEALDINHITEEDMLDIFKREKAVLETIFKMQIVSASQHGDFTGVSRNKENYFFHQYTKEDAGILNQPFEERFCKDMKYISDSLGTWPEGCMCRHIGQADKLQINIHPIYWFHQFYHLDG